MLPRQIKKTTFPDDTDYNCLYVNSSFVHNLTVVEKIHTCFNCCFTGLSSMFVCLHLRNVAQIYLHVIYCGNRNGFYMITSAGNPPGAL